jgi:phage-related protein
MQEDAEKRLIWIGSSKRDLLCLPAPVRRFFGHALYYAQRGERHESTKVMKGFGSAGILEIIEDDAQGTYRAVYTVRFSEAVFVLHCFQKKSLSGISTPKRELDIIRTRLKMAEHVARELQVARKKTEPI